MQTEKRTDLGKQGIKLLTTFLGRSTKFDVQKKHGYIYITDNGLLARIPDNLAKVKTNITAKEWKIFDETLETKDELIYLNKNKIRHTLKSIEDFDSCLIRINDLVFQPEYIKIITKLSFIFQKQIYADVQTGLSPTIFVLEDMTLKDQIYIAVMSDINIHDKKELNPFKEKTTRTKDERLISQALKTPPERWNNILSLKQATEDKKTQERLHNIAVSKFHREEFEAGML